MRPIDADAVERSIWREWLCSRTIKQKELCDILEKIIVRCCEHIDASPTIDVEPVRHGHWIVYEDNERECYCSNCEFPAGLDAYGYHNMQDPYCRFCGAKMDGKENNND